MCSLPPVGFMTGCAADPAAAVEIVICTGHGPQSLTFDDAGVPVQPKAPMDGKNLPYATAGAVTVDHDASHQRHTVRYAAVSYRITA